MQNNENEIVYLYLDDIIPNRFQPRQVFDEKALKELAVSIKEHGVIQPIIVRNIGNKYEIIAGERRYKASALAGLTKIPAIVRNLDDKESSKVALLENLQRKNLNPIEEARTYQKILELDQMTQEELAKTMGKSQSAVANKIRLLSLTDEVQDALLKEQISERHARTLLNITDPQKQKEMLKEIIDKKMTVRELEETIKQMNTPATSQMETSTITPSDIERILQPTPPVPNSNGTTSNIPEIAPTTTPTFNQSIGIDYSTPPKFIDYGEDIQNSQQDLTSTAANPVNIDDIRANAKDINIEPQKTNVDNLLIPTTDSEDEGTNGGHTFKFFDPLPTADNNNTQNANQSQSFEVPPVTNTNTTDLFNSSAAPAFTANETTGMDSILQGVNASSPSEEENNIPYVDMVNNPFARNPLFADDVQKIEESKMAKMEPAPKYDLNESIELVRNAVKSIENSGFKVDTEEMNFDKNYQIVIKIAKN